MDGKPTFLLINPWIYDFAAFDLYLKPYGLLLLAANLKKTGANIIFLDCMNRKDKYFLENNLVYDKKYGTGKFYYEIIEKPKILDFYPRYYKRYGLPYKEVEERLCEIRDTQKIDGVLVTSIMNYWYLGVFDMIKLVKKFFNNVPIILGGIYATLMYEHASKYSGADFIIPNNNLYLIIKKISEICNVDLNFNFLKNYTMYEEPLFDLYDILDYLVVLLTYGCPFNCSYCASHLLYSGYKIKSLEKVIKSVKENIENFKINDIAFYDDALLFNYSKVLKKFLNGLKKINVRFHTPNGLHIRYITRDVAEDLFEYNFKTLRLSLETISDKLQKETGKIISREEFKNAIKNLLKAGFNYKQIEVYILFGLPSQKFKEIVDTISFVKDCGAVPKIVEYSLIFGTKDFKKFFTQKNIDPLLTNNSLFYLKFTDFTMDDLQKLKELAKI